MKKNIGKQKIKHELWFSWLTRKLNSFEDCNKFDLNKTPEDLAEDFICMNKFSISEVLNQFDEEDKDTLSQFYRLIECEWHVLRILKTQLDLKNKVRFVDFKKEKNKIRNKNNN